MITYFKMKRNEWKVKAKFYGMIANLMDNHKEITTALENLYAALKDDTSSNQVSSDTAEQ
mgnify:CR=1 FL=1